MSGGLRLSDADHLSQLGDVRFEREVFADSTCEGIERVAFTVNEGRVLAFRVQSRRIG